MAAFNEYSHYFYFLLTTALGRRLPIRLASVNGNFQYIPEVPLIAQKRQVWGTFRTFPAPPDPESPRQILGRQVEG